MCCVLPRRPQRVAVVGSSYIAVELASILRGLGSDTSLVLRRESVLRSFEPMLGEAALVSLRDDGVEVVTQASPERLERDAQGLLTLQVADGRRLGPFDALVWAIGRVPAIEDLALPKAGVTTNMIVDTRPAVHPGNAG